MSTVTATTSYLSSNQSDPQIERSKRTCRRFAMLVIPLAFLLLTFKVYNLEQPAFLQAGLHLVFGGFAVSYWLPFRFKEHLPDFALARRSLSSC